MASTAFRLVAATHKTHLSNHTVGIVIVAVLFLAILLIFGALFSTYWRPKVMKTAKWLLGSLIALYFVARGIAEFWVVNYSNPSSYRNSWGGPTLIGVFAVHTGPGILIILFGIWWLWRRKRSKV